MTMFWSPTAGFVADGINDIPPDAIAITNEQWQALVEGVNQQRKVITVVAGVPTLADPAPVSLVDAQSTATAALRAACAAQITGGYVSAALGSDHTYPSGTVDQINMMGSVTASLLPGLPTGWTTPFWCADSTGKWGYANHTAAQIQQAGADGKAAIVAAQTKLAQLSANVAAAQTAEVVNSITW